MPATLHTSSIDSRLYCRIDQAEFSAGLSKLGMALPEDEAQATFAAIDSNDGGQILFHEFCKWVVTQRVPVD
jgi:Ca2+-binding EF-hand superfamily protein